MAQRVFIHPLERRENTYVQVAGLAGIPLEIPRLGRVQSGYGAFVVEFGVPTRTIIFQQLKQLR